eukprot:IDg5469t1
MPDTAELNNGAMSTPRTPPNAPRPLSTLPSAPRMHRLADTFAPPMSLLPPSLRDSNLDDACHGTESTSRFLRSMRVYVYIQVDTISGSTLHGDVLAITCFRKA